MKMSATCPTRLEIIELLRNTKHALEWALPNVPKKYKGLQDYKDARCTLSRLTALSVVQ